MAIIQTESPSRKRRMTWNGLLSLVTRLWSLLSSGWDTSLPSLEEDVPVTPVIPPTSPEMPPTSDVLPVEQSSSTPNEIKPNMDETTTLLPWDMKHPLTHENYHNVRVICDQTGLTYAQKEILTACVWQESDFMVNPPPNTNKLKDGTVWSTDYGIVQVNDYYNIGKGKPFPSIQYVIENPEACVRWMANIMKTTGRLQPWASYTTGAYKKYLGKKL